MQVVKGSIALNVLLSERAFTVVLIRCEFVQHTQQENAKCDCSHEPHSVTVIVAFALVRGLLIWRCTHFKRVFADKKRLKYQTVDFVAAVKHMQSLPVHIQSQHISKFHLK